MDPLESEDLTVADGHLPGKTGSGLLMTKERFEARFEEPYFEYAPAAQVDAPVLLASTTMPSSAAPRTPRIEP